MGYYFWPRMIATMAGWFINDVVRGVYCDDGWCPCFTSHMLSCITQTQQGFYGGKVFIGDFVSIMDPTAGVQTTWLWTMLQTGVQMFGYYGAAYVVDSRIYGRRRLQVGW